MIIGGGVWLVALARARRGRAGAAGRSVAGGGAGHWRAVCGQSSHSWGSIKGVSKRFPCNAFCVFTRWKVAMYNYPRTIPAITSRSRLSTKPALSRSTAMAPITALSVQRDKGAMCSCTAAPAHSL